MIQFRRAVLVSALLFAPAALSAGEIDLGSILSGQPPGVRQTERLAKKADALIDAIDEAQSQVRTTLDAHKMLIFGNATDLRKPYKALDKAIGLTSKRRETVRRRADEAKEEAAEYFGAWAGSLPSIQDAELRTRSEERLRDSKARFDGIVAAGERAAVVYEPLAARLRDQWNYLGHDLNASGIESLRPDADAVNAEGNQLIAEIDDSLRQARDYVTSIRAKQPPPPPPPPEPAPAAPPTGG